MPTDILRGQSEGGNSSADASSFQLTPAWVQLTKISHHREGERKSLKCCWETDWTMGPGEWKLWVALLEPMPTRFLVKVVLDLYPREEEGWERGGRNRTPFQETDFKGSCGMGSSWEWFHFGGIFKWEQIQHSYTLMQMDLEKFNIWLCKFSEE